MLSSRRILRWLLPASTRARVHGQVQCRMVINSEAPVSLRGPFGISCPRRATGNSSADRLRGRCVRTRSGKTGWRGLRVEGESSTLTLSLGWKFVDGNGEIFEIFYFSLSKGMKEEENVWKIFVTFFKRRRSEREMDGIEENWKVRIDNF